MKEKGQVMPTDEEEVVRRDPYSLKLEELKWQKQKFSIAMAAFLVLTSFVMIAFWVFYGGINFRNQVSRGDAFGATIYD